MTIAQYALKSSRARALKEIAHKPLEVCGYPSLPRSGRLLLSPMSRRKLKPIVDLAKCLRRHLRIIINSIRLDAKSGNAKGNNSWIQKVKKMACGSRNAKNIRNGSLFLSRRMNFETYRLDFLMGQFYRYETSKMLNGYKE